MVTIAEQFLASDLERRAALAQDDAAQGELARLLGADVLARYRSLADRVQIAGRGHLGGAKRKFIFVPGVMGSLLRPDKLAGVWWIDARTARQRMNDLRLSRDGTTDANPAFAVTPCAIDFAYDPFLTVCLERDDFEAIPFAYDWRKSITLSTALLKRTLDDTYAGTNGETVDLVAHSMGGLLVRAMLAQFTAADWKKVGRIVFVATPHYGATAIAGYLKNHFWGREMLALLGLVLSRETFRSMRGPLELLPAPVGIYPGTRGAAATNLPTAHPCANFDLYDAAKWNLGLGDDERKQLQEALDAGARFHQELYAAHQGLSPEHLQRMLVIAGVGFRTLFRLEVGSRLLGGEYTDKITQRIACDAHREGDGRVPLASALLENVDYRYVRGEHGGLTNLEGVYTDIFNWLAKKPLRLPDSCHGALASHLAPEDDLNLVPSAAVDDDPGFLIDQPLDDARAADLLTALAEGRVTGFEQTRIL